MIAALIAGLSGTKLTSDERSFYRGVRPAGVILFKRNVTDAELVKPLVHDVCEAIGRDDVLVLIDQEGGRVQRLKAPAASDLPAGAAYGQIFVQDPEAAKQAAFNVARLTAEELKAYGINTNCAPVLDIPVAGAHDVIGDRAYGRDPDQVSAIGRAVAEGYLAGGVVPVIKHIPGHGRATSDSHFSLPVVATTHAVLKRSDFAPFKALNDMPAAMTAHVIYAALDPNYPASISHKVTQDIIRGEIGFQGLLMSDDLSMKALKGPFRKRAEEVISAGSDLALHCNGDLAEMLSVAEGVPALGGLALKRFEAAIAVTKTSKPFDANEAKVHLKRLMRERETPTV